MAKITNTTRGIVRPTRRTGDEPDGPDQTASTIPSSPVQTREARPLGPVQRREAPEQFIDDAPRKDVQEPLPAPRGLAADLPIAQIARVAAKSPVSSMAVAQLIAALEQHGRKANISHEAALGVLSRLKSLLDQVTERRSWPRIPSVRRRVQRRRREQ